MKCDRLILKCDRRSDQHAKHRRSDKNRANTAAEFYDKYAGWATILVYFWLRAVQFSEEKLLQFLEGESGNSPKRDGRARVRRVSRTD
jgi:hypothetical protein